MKRNLLNLTFPDGVKQLYINGKRYTREEFIKAKNFSYKRMIAIKQRAVTRSNLNKRKLFVKRFLPFLKAE